MKIILILLVSVLVFCFFDILRTVFLATKSSQLIKQAIPFQRIVPWVSMRILVMGDSTAYGTGAEMSEWSTAGRLGWLYPEAEIINISENGLKIDGLLKKLDDLSGGGFDIILIQIGANDIIRMTSFEKAKQGIDDILSKAISLSDNIIVLHSGNIGESPFFPFFVRPLLAYRSNKFRDIYREKANKYDVSYVDLMASPITEQLRDNPSRYYASDFLHLSSEGYSLWISEIKKFLP